MEQSFVSVGIDIGTTTTQLIFSRITMEAKATGSTIPEVRITGKEILYRSGIHFTPLSEQNRIAVGELQELIAREYRLSGVDRSQVRTGAVIITGESARKENAALVAEVLSGYAGDFVVGTAGPDLEAVLAGWGAGAGEYSRICTSPVVNFDIGGGTTNAAVFNAGEVEDAFALDIGGRLIRLDGHGCISYVSERLEPVVRKLGVDLYVGKKAEFQEMERITRRMAEMFLELVSHCEPEEDTQTLFIGHGRLLRKLDIIQFSGGVAEYIYRTEDINTLEKAMQYGDIGPLLGTCIRQTFAEGGLKLVQPREMIRATVVGAGNYTLRVSGSTVAVDQELLPLKNIPVLQLFGEQEEEEFEQIAERITRKKDMFPGETLAVAFRGKRSPGYQEIRSMARQLLEGCRTLEGPLIVLVEHDFAKALGQTLRILGGRELKIVCLDRIRTREGDYIDLGTQVAGAIPVVIKTLIFNS